MGWKKNVKKEIKKLNNRDLLDESYDYEKIPELNKYEEYRLDIIILELDKRLREVGFYDGI